MRIVLIFPKDKRPGQTEDADQPESRCYSYASDRPEIGNDLRYPRRPILAHPEVGGPPLDLLTEPGDEIQQGGGLMADLMDERRRNAAADHTLPRHANQSDGIVATAREACPGAADCGADSLVQVAEHRRGIEVRRQRQGVRGHHVQPREPYAGFIFTALGNRIAEHVELCDHGVKTQLEQCEAALGSLRRGCFYPLPTRAIEDTHGPG